ncbi:hypothetical protein KUTeg_003135 [Tegillarca granosa]|uniref:PI3K/PI4K catalytic domain-containing protein n=1 Tax=Tegillarca granosa TaxID=220873 RepID=A0ABQ9FL95_TEGGR|nr:hypothetical protein KUTeg_003135 [Tegillarca granosa]
MTPRVGLIEWLDNTTPLKEFVYGSLTDQEQRFMKTDGPGKLQDKWLKKLGNYERVQLYYHEIYKRYSKTETVKEFKLKESKLPWDLLRRSFHQMSTSPEAFHVLRCTFAVSHALICICHYILGIGDRHLSNFMVNLKTGEMIGIDFGHAFGSATQSCCFYEEDLLVTHQV